jgi:hypothetical protein
LITTARLRIRLNQAAATGIAASIYRPATEHRIDAIDRCTEPGEREQAQAEEKLTPLSQATQARGAIERRVLLSGLLRSLEEVVLALHRDSAVLELTRRPVVLERVGDPHELYREVRERSPSKSALCTPSPRSNWR